MIDRKGQTGFTLIELLITVVVLGILLALGAPNLFSVLETRKIKGAGENVMADLQFAKSESIKRNAPVILSYVNGSSWCYGIAVNASCTCTTPNSCSIDGIERVVRASDFDADMSLTAAFNGGTATQTGFEPTRGFSENLAGSTSNGSVTLQLATGPVVKVIVSRFGRIRICSTTGTGGYESCT